MCGIIGYYSKKNIDKRKLLSSLVHRGPDANGFYTSELKEHFIGLGHTRLKIVDLSSNGNQPMLSDDKQIVLIFNGEIYNYQELKSKYFSKENFKSTTDTEVLLKLYIKFGLEFITELNGDFAFSIYDKRTESIHLVRDRVGVKPLYYYFEADCFAFSSELKGLFEIGVPKKIDIHQIQNYFIFKYSPQNKTLIKNILRVNPATILTFKLSDKSISEKKYWELKKQTKYQNLTYFEAKNELKNIMQLAVCDRLIADVPLGNFLSGGIDSSIIAYYLKNNLEIKHFCATKNQEDLIKEGSTSDGKYAELLANKWNLNLINIPISSNETNEDLIKKTLFFSDDLIADGSQIPSYLIAHEAKKEATVLLSGMGADELFLGYAGHQISMISTQIDAFPSFLKNPIYSWMKNLNQGKGALLAYRRYLHKLGKYATLKDNKFAYFNIVGDVLAAKSIFNIEGKNIFADYFSVENSSFDAVFHFEMDNFLQKNLQYLDRMTMANGVEARVPFLDHRLIEFAYSLPLKFKLSKLGNTKIILKDAYKNELPKEILNRRKAGFGMPLRSIFSDEKQVYRLLKLDFFASFEGFEMENIKNIIHLHTQGKEDHSALIYALISFQFWYEMHID